MRNILLVVLSFLFICGPSYGLNAESISLDTLEKAAGRQIATRNVSSGQKSQLTTRQKQIIRALDKVRLRADDPNIWEHVISWDQFEKNSQKLTAELEKKYQHFQQDMANSLELQWPYIAQMNRPDYGKETKGIPFVYLTDASSHDTQSIVREIKQVMISIRKANPQARILLALEFAEMTDFATPIRFAHKANKKMQVTAPYNLLVKQADQLGMDILALDDFIFFQQKPMAFYKIGRYLIIMDDLSKPSFISDPFHLTTEEFDKLRGFIGVSSVGMQQRNIQWASYINAVKPFYDIVIVYSGNAHTDGLGTTEHDVPDMVGQLYAQFDFYTTERSKRADEFEEAYYAVLCDSKACVQVPGIPQIQTPNIPQWDGKSIMTLKLNTKDAENYIQTLPPDQQEKYLDKEELAPLVFSSMVFLPDITYPQH